MTSMPDREDPHGIGLGSEAHQRWFAMKSAYTEYRRASEELEYCRRVAKDMPGITSREPALLESRRDAFEQYLEARLEFLETQFDETLPKEGGPVSMGGSQGPGLRPAVLRRLLPGLTIGLFVITVISLARTEKHARDVSAVRDELRFTLSENREHLQALAQKLDALEPPEP